MSSGVRSGQRGSHSSNQPYAINCSWNVSIRYSLDFMSCLKEPNHVGTILSRVEAMIVFEPIPVLRPRKVLNIVLPSMCSDRIQEDQSVILNSTPNINKKSYLFSNFDGICRIFNRAAICGLFIVHFNMQKHALFSYIDSDRNVDWTGLLFGPKNNFLPFQMYCEVTVSKIKNKQICASNIRNINVSSKCFSYTKSMKLYNFVTDFFPCLVLFLRKEP
ncbi:hypothetical protein AVEN_19689-1 [Araneus ventricosus]|uniref:Uncharacterized protein n=1 Tax=Araneus ventricosus TaxID=182803 RepID=A0A4Y2C2J6_ARAVE|nr:hypothetical protein AVEN_19689-1 [Araneus ventricosus]